MEKNKKVDLKNTQSKNASNVKNKSKQQHKQKKRKISIFTLGFLAVVIMVVFAIYFALRYLVITLKYNQYKEKMDMYNLSELYNNQKADSLQKVENLEMIKVIIGSVMNTKDINTIYYTDTNNNELDKWYEYSVKYGLNTRVQNNNEIATKSDAAIILVNAIEILLGEEIEQTNLGIPKNKLAMFTEDEKTSISKAVNLGLIENKGSEISTKSLLKGELNKMIINVVEKYSTIYYGSIKEDYKANLVTDKSKLPSNYKEYPYIVDNIDKEIYELDFTIQTQRTAQTPKVAYTIMGDLYMQIDELITRYFDNILNIDYTKITENNFLNSIKNDVVYAIEKEDVQDYVKYVKDNKIKLQGKATPLLPIMYNNGEQYVVRTKIEFTILNSNTTNNILFGDEKSNVNYNGKEFILYVDVPMGMTANAYSLRIHTSCMAKYLAKPNIQISLGSR